MIGFVYKDLLVLRKQLAYYSVFVLLYTGLTVMGVFGPDILPALVVMMALMIPMSSFAYDDQARWDKFAAATPAGRPGIVAGKYLLTLLVLVVGSLLVGILLLLIQLFPAVEVTVAEGALSIMGCAGVALMMDAVILPLLFRFGAEKSRIISLVLFLLVFGGTMSISLLVERGIVLPLPPEWLLAALPVVLIAVSLGLFALSFALSLHVYGKKAL